MRRFFVILAGFGMISSGLACQHTAGKCDCTPPLANCNKYGLYASETAVEHAVPAQQMMQPAAPAKMIPAGGIDDGTGVSVIPSVGVSWVGD